MSLQDGGYTLEQLLSWCEEDRLIDGFEMTDESISLYMNGGTRTLDYHEARVLLKGIFTATHRGSETDDIEA